MTQYALFDGNKLLFELKDDRIPLQLIRTFYNANSLSLAGCFTHSKVLKLYDEFNVREIDVPFTKTLDRAGKVLAADILRNGFGFSYGLIADSLGCDTKYASSLCRGAVDSKLKKNHCFAWQYWIFYKVGLAKRCVVTGEFDASIEEDYPAYVAAVRKNYPSVPVPVECRVYCPGQGI